MAIFLPFLGLTGGSIFLNHQASQQLEMVGKDEKFGRMFWPPFTLGILLGLWFGVSFGPRIQATIEFIDGWTVWLLGIKRVQKQQLAEQ
jgi:hypothetical protein